MRRVLCLLFAASCTPSERAADILYAGCEAVMAGPRCVLGTSRQLRLWSPQIGPAAARTDLGEITATRESRAGGTLLTIDVPPAATRLTVSAGSKPWSLALADATPPAAPLVIARQRKAAGDCEGARELLAGALAELGPRDRALALGVVARCERALGDSSAAIATFKEAVALHRTQGAWLDEVNDATALVYVLLHNHRRFAEAREVLAAATDHTAGAAPAEYYVRYYGGVLALETGDFRTALAQLHQAAAIATRVDDGALYRYAEQQRVRALQAVGRHQEALERLASVLAASEAAGACEAFVAATNYGWALLLARESGVDPSRSASSEPPSAVDASATLHAARRWLAACPAFATDEGNLHLNLALAALHDGALDDAAAALDGARAAGELPPLQELWALDLEGRLGLARANPARALRAYETLVTRAATSGEPAVRWRAQLGLARASQALGRRREALLAYTRAEALVYQDSLAIPLHEGREGFLAERRRATQEHVEALLAAGNVGSAFAVALRARAQVLASVRWQDRVAGLAGAARQRWEQSLADYGAAREGVITAAAALAAAPRDLLPAAHQDLADAEAQARRALDVALTGVARGADDRWVEHAPLPGELTLAYVELTEGWVGFAAEASGTSFAKLGILDLDASPAGLSAQLLQPFAPALRRAQHVRILAVGDVQAIDFHALPFRDGPLLATLPVFYGVDLPSPGPRHAGGALVVSDPRGDLPGARSEAKRVLAALRPRYAGAALSHLTGEAVRAATLRQLLPEVRLFHFAGHATFGDGAGGGALVLGGGELFTAGDILTLPAVPDVVVLSACRGGESARTTVQTLGLAQAFIAAGTRTVITAARPLNDFLASRVAHELYALPARDLPTRLRHILVGLASSGAAVDWAAYRVIVP